MSTLFRRLIVVTTALSVAMLALPATAQWVGSGRWGSDGRFRHITPGTWMVLRPQGAQSQALVSAEGMNHDGRMMINCAQGDEQAMMVFDQYFGNALSRPVEARDVTAQIVSFVIDGQGFESHVAYDIAHRHWSGPIPNDPQFLETFGWGSRMELRNSSGDVISQFRLNNSGGARGALRQYCGL